METLWKLLENVRCMGEVWKAQSQIQLGAIEAAASGAFKT